MPEETTVAPAAAPAATPPSPSPAPAAAPAPAPAAPEPKGDVPAPSDTPAPQTPAEKARASMEAVLGNKPEKVVEKPADDMSQEDMEKVIKPNSKAWRVYEGFKKSTQQKISELEAKIKAAESKPNPTAADDSKLKALEKQLADLGGESKTLKQKLAERDYRESDDYKSKFVEPWNRTYTEAYQFVSRLNVLNEDGEVARQATNADFDKIMAMEPQQRRAAAKAMFGEDVASDVVDYAKELLRLDANARDAVKTHAANFEKVHAEREQATAKEQAQYQQFQQDAMSDLQAKYPDYFSPEHYKDQPEFQKALQSGYEFLDSISKDDSMTPKDRADVAAVVRGYAASFPLLVAQRKADKAEIEALKAELGKYRQSDPGSEPSKPVVAPTGDAPVGGIAEYAAKFGQMS